MKYQKRLKKGWIAAGVATVGIFTVLVMLSGEEKPWQERSMLGGGTVGAAIRRNNEIENIARKTDKEMTAFDYRELKRALYEMDNSHIIDVNDNVKRAYRKFNMIKDATEIYEKAHPERDTSRGEGTTDNQY